MSFPVEYHRDKIIEQITVRLNDFEQKMNRFNDKLPMPVQTQPLYPKWREKDINSYILNMFGHILSKEAFEIAVTLKNDGWTQGAYELLITAETLAKDD